MGLLKVIENQGLNKPRGLLHLVTSRGLDKTPLDASGGAAKSALARRPRGLLARSMEVLQSDGKVKLPKAEDVAMPAVATRPSSAGGGTAASSSPKADDLPSIFDAALKTGDAVLCRLDVAKAVEESLDDPLANGDAKGATDDDKGAIYQQLLQIARHTFPAPSYCAAVRNGAMKLVLFVGEDFDQDTALVHIRTHFKGALGDAAQDVLLLDALKGTSTKQIMSFIDPRG